MNYGLIVYDSKCIYIRYINMDKWKKMMPKIIFYPNTTPTLSTQRAAWTLLPHDFTSSLTLSLTLSREQLLKLSVSCFFPPRCRPCGWSCHQFSPRPCFNTSPGITAAWADIYIYSFYTDSFFFSSLNLLLGRLTCREGAHGASQPAELRSNTVRTVLKNATSGFRGSSEYPREQLFCPWQTWEI